MLVYVGADGKIVRNKGRAVVISDSNVERKLEKLLEEKLLDAEFTPSPPRAGNSRVEVPFRYRSFN